MTHYKQSSAGVAIRPDPMQHLFALGLLLMKQDAHLGRDVFFTFVNTAAHSL